MKIDPFLVRCLGVFTALACACADDGSDDAGNDDAGSSDTGAADGSSGDTGEAVDMCTRTIILGRYRDDRCTPGEEVGMISLDLTVACGSWSRSTMMGTKDDSFTRLQCFSDRLCFTVHPGSATCEPGEDDGDVELPVGACQRDKTPEGGTPLNNFTKILDGVEGCPAPPAGFLCPVSGIGEGTQGVLACSG